MRRSNAGAAFGAFLGGALVGGIVALLFAPRSGAETREIIREFVEDEVDMVKEKATQARDFATDEINKYKRKARRAVGEIQEMVEEAKEAVAEEIKRTTKSAAGC